MAKDRLSDKLAVILHADVAGSTLLVQLDEHLAHERIQDPFRRFSDIIEKYTGKVLEFLGDALLAEFERASDAVNAALAFEADPARVRPEVRRSFGRSKTWFVGLPLSLSGVFMARPAIICNDRRWLDKPTPLTPAPHDV